MKIHYYTNNRLVVITEDYKPSVGENITIDDVEYEVTDVRTKIVALHTEFDVTIVEK